MRLTFLFCLCAFFLLSCEEFFQPKPLKMDLSKDSATVKKFSPEQHAHRIYLTLNHAYVSSPPDHTPREVSPAGMDSIFRQWKKADTACSVIIMTNKEATYSKVIEVMDRLRVAEIEKMALVEWADSLNLR